MENKAKLTRRTKITLLIVLLSIAHVILMLVLIFGEDIKTLPEDIKTLISDFGKPATQKSGYYFEIARVSLDEEYDLVDCSFAVPWRDRHEFDLTDQVSIVKKGEPFAMPGNVFIGKSQYIFVNDNIITIDGGNIGVENISPSNKMIKFPHTGENPEKYKINYVYRINGKRTLFTIKNGEFVVLGEEPPKIGKEYNDIFIHYEQLYNEYFQTE